MTTDRFRRLASPIAQAKSQAYHQAKDGADKGSFQCTAPGCRGVIEFTARPAEPHVSAGRCNSKDCVRWTQD